jgi:hypothetical protein
MVPQGTTPPNPGIRHQRSGYPLAHRLVTLEFIAQILFFQKFLGLRQYVGTYSGCLEQLASVFRLRNVQPINRGNSSQVGGIKAVILKIMPDVVG